MPQKKILIVEDDLEAREILKRCLEQEGFEVQEAQTGEQGLKLANSLAPNLMILDLNLPGIDGFEVLKNLTNPKFPIVVVTARQDDTDKVIGLELGADDYLTKPFNPRVLLAQIHALLRRVGSALQEKTSPSILTAGELVLNLSEQTLKIKETSISLTVTEYSILKLFMQNQGKVLARHYILDQIWGSEFFGEMRVVDLHIRNLRKRFSAISPEKEYIQSIRGVGYKFEP
jgi:two-component system alkaline phosphatase synthesis response regulator PhoP